MEAAALLPRPAPLPCFCSCLRKSLPSSAATAIVPALLRVVLPFGELLGEDFLGEGFFGEDFGDSVFSLVSGSVVVVVSSFLDSSVASAFFFLPAVFLIFFSGGFLERNLEASSVVAAIVPERFRRALLRAVQVFFGLDVDGQK